MEDRKTSILIFDEFIDSGPEDSDCIDLGDFLIADLASTIKDISGCFVGLPSVQIGDTTVTIEEQNVEDDARERLDRIVSMANVVMEKESHLQPEQVFVPILGLDGWSWTKVTLRTPLWLRDVQEWPLNLVYGWFGELVCLETFISS